jgi:uncharacterized membrane protein YdjX (TVP38/TMEM64 family)
VVVRTRDKGAAKELGAADVTAKIRFVILVVMVTLMALLALGAHFGGWLTQDDIHAVVESGGLWSPLIYLVVASLLIVAWFPRVLLSMVAGALFGIGLGAFLALIMGTVGALGGYLLGIKLGHPYLAQKSAKRASKAAAILAFVQLRGFWAVLACRVCPLIPSELISVTSGTTAIPLHHFVGASLLGMAPGAFLYAAFGASLLDPESWWVTWSSVAGFALLTVITGAFLMNLWRRESRLKIEVRTDE